MDTARSRPGGSPSGAHRRRQRRPSEESTATGIYGIIVSAAVMAAAHADTALAVAIAVLVTLLIYWAAERYSRLVAARIHDGRRPTWAHVRHQLASGWEFVTASFVPLLVLLTVRLLGGSLYAAVISALLCSTLLLSLAGWEIGASGRLSRTERFATAVVAGLFGVGMVLLKALLH